MYPYMYIHISSYYVPILHTYICIKKRYRMLLFIYIYTIVRSQGNNSEMENKFALKLLEIRQSNRNVNKNIKMSIRSKKKKKRKDSFKTLRRF